jgi:hypothetical protein
MYLLCIFFCHFIYVWLVWNNADVEINFIIQYLLDNSWLSYMCLYHLQDKTNNVKRVYLTKSKYKDICKSERWYANKNKELNNYWIYLGRSDFSFRCWQKRSESTGRSQNIYLIVPLFTFAGHYRGIRMLSTSTI